MGTENKHRLNYSNIQIRANIGRERMTYLRIVKREVSDMKGGKVPRARVGPRKTYGITGDGGNLHGRRRHRP